MRAARARARGVVGGQCPELRPLRRLWGGRGRGRYGVAVVVGSGGGSAAAGGGASGDDRPGPARHRQLGRRWCSKSAWVSGDGSVPAAVARAWPHEGLDGHAHHRRAAAPPQDAGPERTLGAWRRRCGSHGFCCTGVGAAVVTRPRTGGTWWRWTRGGGCSGGCCGGCWCCVMTCAPRRGVRRRSCTPTSDPGGVSTLRPSFEEGNGKCTRLQLRQGSPRLAQPACDPFLAASLLDQPLRQRYRPGTGDDAKSGVEGGAGDHTTGRPLRPRPNHHPCWAGAARPFPPGDHQNQKKKSAPRKLRNSGPWGSLDCDQRDALRGLGCGPPSRPACQARRGTPCASPVAALQAVPLDPVKRRKRALRRVRTPSSTWRPDDHDPRDDRG